MVLFSLSFGFSWIVLGFAAVSAMRCNPADPAVGSSEAIGRVEEGKPFCSICQVTVRTDSKHCWECNKCVANFDHHCPWLNNCIGNFNYASFFVSVWALFAMLTVLIGGATAPLHRLCTDAGVEFWLLIATLAAYSPLWCLDVSLAAFHCYLCWQGTTTYEHLTGKTKRPPSASRGQRSSGGAETLGVGERTISERSFASTATVVAEHLQREVSDFICGSSEPADPAEGAIDMDQYSQYRAATRVGRRRRRLPTDKSACSKGSTANGEKEGEEEWDEEAGEQEGMGSPISRRSACHSPGPPPALPKPTHIEQTSLQRAAAKVATGGSSSSGADGKEIVTNPSVEGIALSSK